MLNIEEDSDDENDDDSGTIEVGLLDPIREEEEEEEEKHNLSLNSTSNSIEEEEEEEEEQSLSEGNSIESDLSYSENESHGQQRSRVYKELDHVRDEFRTAFSWALSISVLLFAIMYYSFSIFIIVSLLVIILNSLDYNRYYVNIRNQCDTTTTTMFQTTNTAVGSSKITWGLDYVRFILLVVIIVPWNTLKRTLTLLRRWFWLSIHFISLKIVCLRDRTPDYNIRTE